MGTGNGVVDTPAGNDTIFGRGGDDTLVGGDRGQHRRRRRQRQHRRRPQHRGLRPHGDPRRRRATTRSSPDSATTRSSATPASNTLAYASVQQQGLDIVDRGTNGVTATLPNAGLTATGGKTGGPEQDIIHSDIGTLVGSNGNDVLIGNNLANQIVGVAPAGTAGVKPGPAGNDALVGNGGNDLLLGAEGNDFEFGGAGNDLLLGVAGNDFLVGQAGADNFNAGEGNDRNFARDGVAEPITCGPGTDSVRPTRSTPARGRLRDLQHRALNAPAVTAGS